MEYDNGGLISGPKLVVNNTGRPIPVYPRMQEGETVEDYAERCRQAVIEAEKGEIR